MKILKKQKHNKEYPCGSRGILLASSGMRKLFLLALLALLLISLVYAVGVGAVPLGRAEIFQIILERIAGEVPAEGAISSTGREIILNIRLPRVLLAALVGASLAVAGATMQGLFRNPLVDPYIIGVSSGAALGAAVAIVSGLALGIAGFSAVPVLAFAGGLLTIVLVYSLSRQGNAIPVMTMLLAGIAVGAFLSAFVSMIIFFSGERLHQVVFWMMGGLGGARWNYLEVMLPYVLIGCGCIYYFARELNAMLLGEDTAHTLGIDPEKLKKIFLIASSLLVAAAVSTSGVIGFIGLVVPHIVRLLAGPDHRFLLPAAAMSGAIMLVAADTLARTIIAPAELPVGIITALLGAPFFLYLLRKRKKMRYF